MDELADLKGYKELPNQFKDFLYCQRKVDLGERYLHVYANIAVQLYQYMQAFAQIEFEDGKYYTYAGQLRVVVNNFIQYWMEIMNEILKEADSLMYNISVKKLLQMIDITLEVQAFKQKSFAKLFLPTNSKYEKQLFDEIRQRYRGYVRDLIMMKETVIALDKPKDVIEFAAIEFDRSVKRRNEVFKMAHTKIALRLAKDTYKIKTSLEEKRDIARNNLSKLNQDRYSVLNTLLDKLYDANKDKLKVSRQDKHRDSDNIEVERRIKDIREKIEGLSINTGIDLVDEELKYWSKRLADFLEIERVIKTVGGELDNVNEFLKEYESLRSTELPLSAKKKCWDTMGENYIRRKAYLEKTYVNAAKALLTFFAVRGRNRILYKNRTGKYAVDDYGHQVYVFNYGRDNFHVKCDGSYQQFADNFRYLFDENGRYVLDSDGTKLYKRAFCASLYKLNDDKLMVKVTKDCGHSEVPNPNCQMQCKDPHDIELLPMAEPVDIRGTLTPEVTKYLWSGLSHVLCNSLCNVGLKNHKNPIYYLAHEIIRNKYTKTHSGLQNAKKEFAEYRVNKHTEEKKRQVKLAQAWKQKQVKKRKPEESDDAENLALARTQRDQDRLTLRLAEEIS